MTIRLLRAGLVKLHQEKATGIKTVLEKWPMEPLDRFEFPLVLLKQGEGKPYREGYVTNQPGGWQAWIFLAEKTPKGLVLAEEKAIDLTQELIELYLNPDNETVYIISKPPEECEEGNCCEYAQLVQTRPRQGETGIAHTPVATLEYWAKEYYGIIFDIPTVEKKQ